MSWEQSPAGIVSRFPCFCIRRGGCGTVVAGEEHRHLPPAAFNPVSLVEDSEVALSGNEVAEGDAANSCTGIIVVGGHAPDPSRLRPWARAACCLVRHCALGCFGGWIVEVCSSVGTAGCCPALLCSPAPAARTCPTEAPAQSVVIWQQLSSNQETTRWLSSPCPGYRSTRGQAALSEHPAARCR